MPQRSFRREWWALLALLVLATGLRLCALQIYSPKLRSDPDLYRGIAEGLQQGRGYVHPETGMPTAYRPPVYPLILWLVLGRDADGHELEIAALHLVLGVATVWLLQLLARRLHLGNYGLIAILLMAIDPLSLYNVTQVMTETVATFLVTVTLIWMLRPEATATRSGTRAFFEALLTGLLVGICGLCRPTFFAWGLLLAGAWGLRWCWGAVHRDAGRGVGPHAGRTALAALLGCGFVVTPWAARNLRLFGEPIFSTTHGGYTLLLGHNPVYYGEVVRQPWGAVWSEESLREWQHSLEERMAAESPDLPRDEVERDRWMYERAKRRILIDPEMAFRAGLTLVGRLWNVQPLQTHGDRSRSLTRRLIGAVYIAWFTAMLAGLLRLRREEWGLWWPGVALLLSFTAVHFWYWADMRMRAPLVPVMAVLAARAFRREGRNSPPAPLPAPPAGHVAVRGEIRQPLAELKR